MACHSGLPATPMPGQHLSQHQHLVEGRPREQEKKSLQHCTPPPPCIAACRSFRTQTCLRKWRSCRLRWTDCGARCACADGSLFHDEPLLLRRRAALPASPLGLLGACAGWGSVMLHASSYQTVCAAVEKAAGHSGTLVTYQAPDWRACHCTCQLQVLARSDGELGGVTAADREAVEVAQQGLRDTIEGYRLVE